MYTQTASVGAYNCSDILEPTSSIIQISPSYLQDCQTVATNLHVRCTRDTVRQIAPCQALYLSK